LLLCHDAPGACAQESGCERASVIHKNKGPIPMKPMNLIALLVLVLPTPNQAMASGSGCTIDGLAGLYETAYGQMRCEAKGEELQCCYGNIRACDTKVILSLSSGGKSLDGKWLYPNGTNGAARFAVAEDCSLDDGLWGSGARLTSAWSVGRRLEGPTPTPHPAAAAQPEPAIAQALDHTTPDSGAPAGLSLPPGADGQPSFPSDVSIDGLEYRLGGVTIIIDEGSRCSGAENGAILFSGNPSPDEWQTTVRKLAEARRQTCVAETGSYGPRILTLRLNDSRSRMSTTALQAKNFWATRNSRTALIRASQAAEAAARRDAFLASPQVDEHDLANRGWARSELLHETPRYKLYMAQERANRRTVELVMVHQPASDGAPVIVAVTVQQGGSPTVYPAPSFYAEIEQLLARIGPEAWQPRIKHYIAGYHHGKDDRLRVLGPHYVETPVLETGYAKFWDGAERVFPYSMQPNTHIGFDNERQRPAISVTAAIDQFGPSAVETVEEATRVAAAEAAERNAKPLPPEGPSEDYLAEQKRIRAAAMARGLVYRNDAYWSDYERVVIREIIEGFYDGIAVNATAYQAALKNYLEWNSDRCAATIRDPATFTITEVTHSFDGFSSTTTRREAGQYAVPGRFAPIYAAMYDIGDPAIEAYKGARAAYETLQLGSGALTQTAAGLRDTIATVQATNRDLDRLFAEGCTSPLKRQFEEMLFHEAAGLDPRKSTLSIANAEGRSDAVYVPGSSTSYTVACLASNDFPRSASSRRYCRCVDGLIQQLAPGRYDAYAKRHWQFSRDMSAVKDAIDRGQKHPDHRLYGSTRVQCTAR